MGQKRMAQRRKELAKASSAVCRGRLRGLSARGLVSIRGVT